MSRIQCAVAALAACATIVAASASATMAKTVTMHFFSKQVYTRVSDASGHPLPPSATPAPGDRLSFAFNDYAGNHKHHAKRATASDHVVCTLTSASRALCDGMIALGGALILGDDFVLDFASNTATVVQITGGTAGFLHARGTVLVKPVGSSTSDLTIKVST